MVRLTDQDIYFYAGIIDINPVISRLGYAVELEFKNRAGLQRISATPFLPLENTGGVDVDELRPMHIQVLDFIQYSSGQRLITEFRELGNPV